MVDRDEWWERVKRICAVKTCLNDDKNEFDFSWSIYYRCCVIKIFKWMLQQRCYCNQVTNSITKVLSFLLSWLRNILIMLWLKQLPWQDSYGYLNIQVFLFPFFFFLCLPLLILCLWIFFFFSFFSNLLSAHSRCIMQEQLSTLPPKDKMTWASLYFSLLLTYKEFQIFFFFFFFLTVGFHHLLNNQSFHV